MTPHAPHGQSIGWLRPTMPGRDLPAPEPRSRTLAIRSIAVLALVVTVAYLLWRGTSTIALEVW